MARAGVVAGASEVAGAAEASAGHGAGASTARVDRPEEGRPVANLRITLVRSGIGHPQFQKETLRSLGLRRLNQAVEHKDNPSIRGMVKTVEHLVRVEEVEE